MVLSPTFILTPKQTVADKLLCNPPTNPFELMIGGGKGGGKSHYECQWTFTKALNIANQFNLKPSDKPPHVGWIGRKKATNFVGTTMLTWQEIIPPEYYKIKSATDKFPRHFLIQDRIAVDFGGIDSTQDIERFNSAQYIFVVVDQAEETTRDDVATLKASRRKKIDGMELNYIGLWSCNPRKCWLKEDFIDHPKHGYMFVRMLYKDNPHLPSTYVATLEDAYGHRPDLLRAYRDGDWTGLGAIDQVFLEEWLTAAENRWYVRPYRKRLVVIDPARFGDDVCVILGLENTEILEARVLPMCSEPQMVSECAAMSVRLGKVPIVVEVVGVCGVGDQLTAQGHNVIEHRPAAASSNPELYFNLRAEAHNTVARWFCYGVFDSHRGGLVTFHRPEDPELLQIWRKVREQIMWPTYTYRGQKILISPKEDLKAEHEGVSPDFGEAYINGLFYMPVVPEFHEGQTRQVYKESNTAYNAIRNNPMAMA